MATSPMSPGTVLGGRYRLDDLLSEHDGARFWRATDVVLARSVAVHALSSDDPRAAGVLEAARESARVTDPHFLRVLDCDAVDGLTWVINEWGDGDSLDVMLQEGPLPPARAAWLAREVAEAIVAAHAEGVAHGRLHPEAVLVTRAGAVKVIGFVVYTAIAGRDERDPTFGSVTDIEADVIDLAGILYAGLTGRWPGITRSAIPRAPREGRRPLRPRQVRAGVPRTLDAICERVLNREASQHAAPLSTAFEIAAALSDYVGDPAMSAPVDLPAMHQDPAAPEAPATEVVPAVPAEAADGEAPKAAAPPVPEVPATSVPEAHPPTAPEPDQTQPHSFLDFDPRDLRGDDWEPAPPPPPFDQPVDRPLFAETERRVPAGASGPAPGEPPSGWPFDDGDVDEDDGPGRPGRGRQILVIALLVALLAGAMYVAFTLGKGDDEDPPAAGPTTSASATPTDAIPTGEPIEVFRATDFDPEGDPPEENPDQTGRAVDGRPGTAWRTQAYLDNPRLGGLKSGVGLVLDLGSEKSVGSVQLDLVGAPTSYEIWATPPGIDDPPLELADVRRLAGQTATGTVSVARFAEPVRTRYLLVWLTSLPPIEDGRFRGELTEVVPRP